MKEEGTRPVLAGAALVLLLLSLPSGVLGNVTPTAKGSSSAQRSSVPADAPGGPPASSASSVQRPKVVQTQDADFRITPHEANVTNGYRYVSPYGNLTFSSQNADFGYTNLLGNLSVKQSEVSVKIGTAYASPAAPVYSVSAVAFSEAYQLTIGGENCGVMTVSLNASSWSMSFGFAGTGSCGNYDVFWLLAGLGNYCSIGGQDAETTYANSTSTLTSLGNVTQGYLYPNPAGTGTGTLVNFADYGVADFACGSMAVGGTTIHGAAVIFPPNVATVDPSLTESNTCQFATSCSFSTNVTSGDTLIAIVMTAEAFGTEITGISDTQGNSWTQAVLDTYDSAPVSAGGYLDYCGTDIQATKYCQVGIYYAVASASGADTISFAGVSYKNEGIGIMELSGMSAYTVVASASSTNYCEDFGSGWCSWYDFNNYGTSLSLPSGGYDLIVSGLSCAVMDCISGTGSSVQYTELGGSYTTGVQYSLSGASSPATFDYTTEFITHLGGETIAYLEVGAVFETTVQQPVKATASGVSTGTVTASGCDVSQTMFSGDGVAEDLGALPLCTITLTAPTGDVWSGTGTTTTKMTCSSGDCPEDDLTYEHVTQPITANLSGSGSTQTISVSGCSASPTSFSGDGSPQDVTATAACSLTLGLSTPGYVWQTTGTNSTSFPTCDTASCSDISLHYMEYVQPINNPANGENWQKFNLTSFPASVTVGMYDSPAYRLFGGSCGGPPCEADNASSGNTAISYQFNVVFPKFQVYNPGHNETYIYCGDGSNGSTGCDQFMMQAVIEFLTNDTCRARPQGASAGPPAPIVYTYQFSCSEITYPASNFEWIVNSASDNFTDMVLKIDGETAHTWEGDQIFNVTDFPHLVGMTDAYGQSTFAGPDSPQSFANIYSGGGTMTYSGMTPLCKTSCPTTQYVTGGTGEYSNVAETNATGSSSLNQTFFAGTFLSTGQYGGDVLSPGSFIGPPDGIDSGLIADSTGQSAYVQGGFSGAYNGTISVCGKTTGSGTDANDVEIQVSNDNFTTTPSTVYNDVWNGSALGTTNSCKPLVSVTGWQYVRLMSNYSAGSGIVVYVDAIGISVGSYAQSETSTSVGSATVTDASNVLQANDTNSAVLTVSSSGSAATVKMGLGTYYGGKVIVDCNSSLAGATLEIFGSETGATDAYFLMATLLLTGGSQTWQNSTISNFNDAQYIAVVLIYDGHSSTLYVDAIYVT